MTEIRRRVRARCSDCGAVCYYDVDNEPAVAICSDCMRDYETEFAAYEIDGEDEETIQGEEVEEIE
jgi:hypothetical protein